MKKYDLIFYTRYEEPTKYVETSPRYLMPQNVSWFKKLNKKKRTLQHCPGFKDFYRNAISLPSPYPQNIKWNKQSQEWENTPAINLNGLGLQFMRVVEGHDNWQHGIQGYNHLKFKLPFYVKAPKGHNFLLTNNFWQTQQNLHILNGVLNFYHQHSCHINMFVNPNIVEINVKYGESLALLIPLSEKQYNIHYEYIEGEKWSRLQANNHYPISLEESPLGMYEKYVKLVSKLTLK